MRSKTLASGHVYSIEHTKYSYHHQGGKNVCAIDSCTHYPNALVGLETKNKCVCALSRIKKIYITKIILATLLLHIHKYVFVSFTATFVKLLVKILCSVHFLQGISTFVCKNNAASAPGTDLGFVMNPRHFHGIQLF